MTKVFFSYSHKDEDLRDQLEAHLALLKRQGLIDSWHDRRIPAGDELDESISANLESADIVLLLVSSDFLASSYCYSRELARALELHDAGRARVVPVIMRHCDWHSAPFGKLKALPRDGRPVVAWPDRDEALADVAREVRVVVEAGSRPGERVPGAMGGVARGICMSEPPTSQHQPRSSNLRLKKEFSEKDRDEFLRSTFEYVCRYFEGSIDALHERNPDVEGTFERVDGRRMAAMLYRGGKKVAECSIRLDGLGRGGGIAFLFDASAMSGGYNEMLSVDASDQLLYLKSLGMSHNLGREQHLSEEGAAELLWGMFIARLQG